MGKYDGFLDIVGAGEVVGSVDGAGDAEGAGDRVGLRDGPPVGNVEGACDFVGAGEAEGVSDGVVVGALEGNSDGSWEGSSEGVMLGFADGTAEGKMNGIELGMILGPADAKPVGLFVAMGALVSISVGLKKTEGDLLGPFVTAPARIVGVSRSLSPSDAADEADEEIVIFPSVIPFPKRTPNTIAPTTKNALMPPIQVSFTHLGVLFDWFVAEFFILSIRSKLMVWDEPFFLFKFYLAKAMDKNGCASVAAWARWRKSPILFAFYSTKRRLFVWLSVRTKSTRESGA